MYGGASGLDQPSPSADYPARGRGHHFASSRDSLDGGSNRPISPAPRRHKSHHHSKKILGLRHRHWLIITSILFHILCFAGIREVFFRSVLVSDVPTTEWAPIGPISDVPLDVHNYNVGDLDLPGDVPAAWEAPPADAVFVFCVSSLRFDKLTLLDEHGLPVAPFLRSIVEEQGAWAISLARPPTETRPGHGALMAGIYEDPGIFGQNLNWDDYLEPVDSIFAHAGTAAYFATTHRQSYLAVGKSLVDKPGVHSFLDDAPNSKEAGDEVTMQKLSKFLHSSELQAATTAAGLRGLSKQASSSHKEQAADDAGNHKQRPGQGILVWVDLLGLDSVSEPRSDRYVNEVSNIDRKIETMVKEIKARLPKLRTAFIVTADHGLLDEGWHGDEKKQNAYTPLIAWGAGVASPSRLTEGGLDPIKFAWASTTA